MHPDRKLISYLNDSLEEDARAAVEAHVAGCIECSSVASVIGSLRSMRVASDDHPHVSDLASFFYGELKGKILERVASHLGRCSSCTDEIALYASAEKAALGPPGAVEAAAISAAAWARIADWEESSFATPRRGVYQKADQLLSRLAEILRENRQRLHDAAYREMERQARVPGAGMVPVILVGPSGEFRGIDMFTEARDATGTCVLTHAEQSMRYQRRPFHVVMEFSDQSTTVISDFVRRDGIRLPRSVEVSRSEGARADYFIVEDD